MNISKRKQGILAIICTIAMIVTSITVYNPREVKAAASDSGNGMKYTVSGESQDGGLIGFTCSEVKIHNTVDGYMHFAWSGADAYLVDTKTIKAQIDGVDVATYNSNPSDTFIGYSQFKDLEVGEHQIKISGTTSVGEAKEIYATATLKIEKVEGTTELQKPSAPDGLVANIDGTKTYYTIAFGNVATATSYKFYLDGTYKKDITNGGTVTIEELGLEAGKTYKFGVRAVNAAGESDISTIDVKVPGKEEETTTGSSTEPFDPSTIKDSEWTLALNSKTVSYYIADGKADRVNVKPQLEGDSYYMAFLLAGPFKSVTFDGVSKDVKDTSYRAKVSDLTSGYHTLVVTDHYGKESVTIYFKVAKEEETTTAAYKDGEVLVNESNQTKEVPAYPDGDYWQNEYNNMPVKYVKGKKYVAEVVVSSTAAKKIKMVFQRVNIWDFVDANQGYETSIAAGNKVKITYVFEATQSTDNGNFDIYLGSVADKTTLVFESKKLTTYNEVPAGVQTGVEVIPSQTKYTVTEDGVAKEVTEGSSYTFGKNEQGYYDATNGVAYAPEEVITVDRNITVTGIKLNVAMESGAGIKLTTPTGLRFKTNVTGTTDILSHSNIIKTGTIITASDILDGGTVDDDFVKSNKLKLNIENENNGWYGNTAGTFCASIVELQEANYARDFVGVGYVTITYNNNKTKTIYAPSGTVRAVATVAQNIQNSKAIYQDGMTYYNYLKSKGYGTIIDTYAAAKKNNQ